MPRAGASVRPWPILPRERFERGQDVGGLGREGRAVLQQLIGSLGAGIERMARHGEDVAALLGGKTRRDQRA